MNLVNPQDKLSKLNRLAGRQQPPLDKIIMGRGEQVIDLNKQNNLNNELRQVIVNDDVYSDTLVQIAHFSSNSYSLTNDRVNQFVINGVKLFYKKELSNDEYAHYENDNTIIIGVHGVKNMEELLVGAKKIFKPKFVSQHFQGFINKYNQVKNTKKFLVLVGHSLGTQMISTAVKQLGGNPLAVLFAPYIPFKNELVSKFMASNPNFKKILFHTDWIGNKIMRMRPVNTMVYVNFDPTALRTLSGHPLGNFKKNPPSTRYDKLSGFSKLVLGLRN